MLCDSTLDELIMEARSSADQAFRKATYKQCLDIILDWAVEVPIYQRQNAFVMSTERVNIDTVTPDITTFWDWMNDIELLETNGNDQLVVGYDYFSSKFSPFFAKTAYDEDVYVMTSQSLFNVDREGNPVLNGIEGETRSYNGTDYTYTGISDVEIVQNDDGTVDYNITLRDDIVFSDGTPMTIDDVIFSMYVLSDPTYDGSSTFYSVPIEGMEEYRSGMELLVNLICAAGPDNTDFTNWTEEQQTAFWDAFWKGGEKFAQEIVDYCIAAEYGTDVASAAAAWGYADLAADATAADFFQAIVDNYGYDLSDNGINYETAGTSITDFIYAELGDKAAEYQAGVATGSSVPNISGIIKTGDYSMTVHMTTYDAAAIYQLGVTVAPLHYYGDVSMYDYDNNMFGFTKGDLSTVRAKTTQPLGAGPYKFVSYENGVVTFEANENYYKGEPVTKYILFQETAASDKLSGVASDAATFDLTDPIFTVDTANDIKSYNSNGELTGDKLTTFTVDNLGYGYIAMCANNVCIDGDPASDASKNLRKGFATLFAVYRDTVVNSYYGEAASVIQYPISNTSWAAPRPSDEGYEIAFSVDVDGNPIYTDDMTEQERYDAALQAAIGFFKAAGLNWDEASGKFVA
jgi:peptide/nickel transport system substrate-binding protein